MTEQEAIGVMMTEKHCVERNIKHECDRDCVKCDLLMKDNDVLNGYDMAIKALEEIQQYRAIGTLEECRAAVEKKEVRNKAIDDFAETCKQDVMCQTFGLHPRNIDEIAEQLKGGGVNE